jgi:DNA adenine methylase
MPVTDTPLRYPGGKSQLTPLLVDVLRANNLFYGEYAEPFAGGAGLALKLLLNGYVSKIYLNDADKSIHAFWLSVLTRTDDLCERICDAKLTISEWHKQKKIYYSSTRSVLDRGFSTLFLNRTNRSGIISGGVIGGLEQNGNYKLGCRFSKDDLIRKIRRIHANHENINLSCLDAIDFIRHELPKAAPDVLVNLDPPYFGKGRELYTNYYCVEDHARLAAIVKKMKQPWIVTYDDVSEIRNLYCKFSMYSSALNYSVQVKKVGTEILVLGPGLHAPTVLVPFLIAA